MDSRKENQAKNDQKNNEKKDDLVREVYVYLYLH